MGSDTKISWCDHTKNFWMGCTKVSPACDHCYMYRDAPRYGRDPTIITRAKSWSIPRKWDGALVFVCSWSDFFHRDADAWRQEAWDLMVSRPEITWLVLTKRAKRMHEWVSERVDIHLSPMPSNIWLGVTAEDQHHADLRIPWLLRTPAAGRFVSIEPLLELMQLRSLPANLNPLWGACADYFNALDGYGEFQGMVQRDVRYPTLDWVIVGGESGHKARPMDPEWARDLRDQCKMAGTPFFMKQMTKKAPIPADLMVREFPEGVRHVA